MDFDVVAVANHLISEAELEEERVTPLKLHKLLYYAYGWSLVRGVQLFHCTVRRYPLGPVIEEAEVAFDTGRSIPLDPDCAARLPAGEVRDLTNAVWDHYGRYSPGELVRRTHAHEVWKVTPANQVMAKDLIRDQFLQLRAKGASIPRDPGQIRDARPVYVDLQKFEAAPARWTAAATDGRMVEVFNRATGARVLSLGYPSPVHPAVSLDGTSEEGW